MCKWLKASPVSNQLPTNHLLLVNHCRLKRHCTHTHVRTHGPVSPQPLTVAGGVEPSNEEGHRVTFSGGLRELCTEEGVNEGKLSRCAGTASALVYDPSHNFVENGFI